MGAAAQAKAATDRTDPILEIFEFAAGFSLRRPERIACAKTWAEIAWLPKGDGWTRPLAEASRDFALKFADEYAADDSQPLLYALERIYDSARQHSGTKAGMRNALEEIEGTAKEVGDL